MLRLFRKKEMISFSGRSHTRTGILSAGIGFFVVAGFLTIAVVSGMKHGEGGFSLGIAGLLLFALALFGLRLSYKALKQKDIYFRFPVIGAILNGLMAVILMIIYILGFIG